MIDKVTLELKKDEADLLYNVLEKINGDEYQSVNDDLISHTNDNLKLDYVLHKLRNAMNNVKKDRKKKDTAEDYDKPLECLGEMKYNVIDH